MEELRHFGHEHPLTFSQLEKNDNGDDILCNCCLLKISGFAYCCGTRSASSSSSSSSSSCSFFLHKVCAEQLPETMEHPVLHQPEHTLRLCFRGEDLKWPRSLCGVCNTRVRGFTYGCLSCDFVVDARCVARTLTVTHPSHEHPLRPMFNEAVFVCYACHMEKPKGISYLCNTCNFWIHEDCATLPPTYRDQSHVHTLVLTYRKPAIIPRPSDYLDSARLQQYYCRICKGDFPSETWTYHCRVCRHTIHLHCRSKTQRIETLRIDENPDDEANLFHLPMPDDSVSLSDLLLMKHASAGQEDNTRMGEEEEKLIHFSHKHSLTLVKYVQSDDNDKLCSACVRPISSPFYGCDLCNFFLHKWCSQLPYKLRYLSHSHTLVLLGLHYYTSEVFKCMNCGDHSDGFYFACTKCKDYCLDVKCASLPRSIKHEIHEHPLILRPRIEFDKIEGCAACFERVKMLKYVCGKCNFSLHYQCALLPRTIIHRYDKHPFTLTYAPIKDGPDDYYCEFCETQIFPEEWWFYHCIECDQSACVKCIYRKTEWGNTSTSHPHPLSLVLAKKMYPLCQHCQQTCLDTSDQSFTCGQCKIMLHQKCAFAWTRYLNAPVTFNLPSSLNKGLSWRNQSSYPIPKKRTTNRRSMLRL